MPSLAGLFFQRFIARTDAVAIQHPHKHSWSPMRKSLPNTPYANQPLIPWSPKLMHEHLNNELSLGHYMLNAQSEVKLFALDFDLVESGGHWKDKLSTEEIEQLTEQVMKQCPNPGPEQDALLESAWPLRTDVNARALWQTEKHPARGYFADQMLMAMQMFARRIKDELDIPLATAITGGKGFHVYGFTGMIPAADARVLAKAVIESFDRFAPTKVDPKNPGKRVVHLGGDNFYQDQQGELSNFTIEVFPKQDSVNEDGFGNLMALPMGVNQKMPNRRKAFIDLSKPRLMPHPDPFALLETGDPWK